MKLSDFLTDVGRPIAFYPGLRKITGSTTATLFLCQFIYWTGKEASKDGWVYKTSEQIEGETGLSYYEQKGAREKLIAAGLLSEKYARIEHQIYFKVNLDTLNDKWGNEEIPHSANEESSFPECDNSSLGNEEIPNWLISNTENTTYTNPEKKISPDKSFATDCWNTLLEMICNDRTVPPCNKERISLGRPLSFEDGILTVAHPKAEWAQARYARTMSNWIVALKPGARVQFQMEA